MGRETREKIIVTAIELFNKKGATNVSTVQLSNELHISPGNLYYYFDNKEHLIRTIWLEKISPRFHELFYPEDLSSEGVSREEKLMNFFLQFSQYVFAYKFFYLELSSLLNNDPELKEIYKDWSIEMMERIASIFQKGIEVGMIHSETSTLAKNLFVQNWWILSQSGINYADMIGIDNSVEETCNVIVQRLYALLYMYISPESHKKMMQLFEDNGLSFDKYTE